MSTINTPITPPPSRGVTPLPLAPPQPSSRRTAFNPNRPKATLQRQHRHLSELYTGDNFLTLQEFESSQGSLDSNQTSDESQDSVGEHAAEGTR